MQFQTIREQESFVDATHRPATLIGLLDQRALQLPDQLAYTFLLDGETNELVAPDEFPDARNRRNGEPSMAPSTMLQIRSCVWLTSGADIRA